jgi:hypothetical protein
MIEFIREMVAKGFWWAILASLIVCAPFGILIAIFGKKSKLLKTVFTIPGVLFTFYIWSIRGSVGWLIFAIMGAIGIIIPLVASLLGKAVKKAGGGSDTFIASFLSSAADEANKHFPKMIDSTTRLDKTVALPNKVFQFHYTLVNLSKDELDSEELKKNLYSPILNDIKTNSTLKDFRDYKVTIEYIYHDKNGNEVLKLTYEYKDYI